MPKGSDRAALFCHDGNCGGLCGDDAAGRNAGIRDGKKKSRSKLLLAPALSTIDIEIKGDATKDPTHGNASLYCEPM